MTILDTIDNAISDWGTSADAMRWTPEPPSPTPGPLIIVPTMDDLARAARLAADFERVRVHMTAIATQFAEAMMGVGAALRPLFDEVRGGQPKRPARVSQIRRAYRAKGRHW